jgi:hypothetical protein
MAIDSLQKRSSALGLGVFDLTLPPANSGIDQADRQHATGFYSGILAGGAPTETILDYERGFNRGVSRGFSVGAC